MTSRKTVRHYLKQLRSVRVWQLVVLLLLSVIVSLTLLRMNNLTMLELKKAVIAADGKGDASEISKTISELGTYVSHHMNTSLNGGFYMVATAERDREAALKAATENTTVVGSQVAQKASIECQSASVRASYGGYVNCVKVKTSELGGPESFVSELDLPSDELYKINFVAPRWSPDAAGISVAVSMLLVVIIILRITGAILLQLLLKQRFRSIS